MPHDDGLNSRKGQRATRVWPKLSGILWQVMDESRDPTLKRTKLGGPLNDELLGRHGTDILLGSGGHDILWGDWDPRNNNTRQRDILSGGPGNDWLYPSHGRSVIRGGPGHRLRLGVLRQGHDRLRTRHRHRPRAHERRLQAAQLRAHPPLLRSR